MLSFFITFCLKYRLSDNMVKAKCIYTVYNIILIQFLNPLFRNQGSIPKYETCDQERGDVIIDKTTSRLKKGDGISMPMYNNYSMDSYST